LRGLPRNGGRTHNVDIRNVASQPGFSGVSLWLMAGNPTIIKLPPINIEACGGFTLPFESGSIPCMSGISYSQLLFAAG
jgi:hypothetical protein